MRILLVPHNKLVRLFSHKKLLCFEDSCSKERERKGRDEMRMVLMRSLFVCVMRYAKCVDVCNVWMYIPDDEDSAYTILYAYACVCIYIYACIFIYMYTHTYIICEYFVRT
jgi:hypothetical protein